MKYYEILIFLTSVSAAFFFLFFFFTLSERDSGGQPTTRCIGHNTRDSQLSSRLP